MLKKSAIGMLVALLSLGLTGIVVAEDDYPFFQQGNLLQQEMDNVAVVHGNVAPTNTLNNEKVETINPLFCTDELVLENATIAKNTCTEEDLIVQGG